MILPVKWNKPFQPYCNIWKMHWHIAEYFWLILLTQRVCFIVNEWGYNTAYILHSKPLKTKRNKIHTMLNCRFPTQPQSFLCLPIKRRGVKRVKTDSKSYCCNISQWLQRCVHEEKESTMSHSPMHRLLSKFVVMFGRRDLSQGLFVNRCSSFTCWGEGN